MPEYTLTSELKKIIKRNRSFLAYFIAAGSGAILQYIIATLCGKYLNFSLRLSAATGFIVSFPLGFLLSKVFAFKAKKSGNTKREMIKFVMATVISFILTVQGSHYASVFLTSKFGIVFYTIPFINYRVDPIYTFSLFFGMGLSFIFNFITHKRFTFVETGIYDKLKSYGR